MKYSVDKQEKYTLLKLNEEKLDATVSPELKSTFVTLNAEGTKSFIVDLSEVKYVDSSGLSAILIANRLCNEQEGTLALTGLTDHVMKLVKISQLEKVLNILNTVEESVDLVLMNSLEKDLTEEAQNEESEDSQL
ncbi:MAG: STAS domain-containing protein [Microscillaceae bacterium]|nr:STAS domain-containing protein [Microscillaceae bacterium]